MRNLMEKLIVGLAGNPNVGKPLFSIIWPVCTNMRVTGREKQLKGRKDFSSMETMIIILWTCLVTMH